jgi:ADP-heptose:LPS heptosyltransferase
MEGWPSWLTERHWQVIGEGYDKVINLYGSIEFGLLCMENQNEYYMSQELRASRYAGRNFYDETTIFAGYPDLVGKYHGEMFFTPTEEDVVSNWLKLPKFEGKHLVMVNISGTGPHKRFVQAKEYIHRLIEADDNVHVITTGCAECKDKDVVIPGKTTSLVGRFPFRQAALVSKYMDCVVGCESGMMCVATMWHTPVVQLMTATDIIAHNKYNPNDYSLQSPARCSPCYKGPYQYRGCPSVDGNPLCVYFDVDKIVDRTIEALYANINQ